MERNQAISVAVGVGAVGTALAYLGYSYYTENLTQLIWLRNLNNKQHGGTIFLKIVTQ